MAFFTCLRPECGVTFKRRIDCKVKWKLDYCIETCRDLDRLRVRREKNRRRQARWRAKKK